MNKRTSAATREGVRLLRDFKAANGLTAAAMAIRLGYNSTDSYFRICRYEYLPSPEVCSAIAVAIDRSRAWVMDHWASEVARQKAASKKRSVA